MRIEIALFAGYGKEALRGFGGISGRADAGFAGIDQPSEGATKHILERFGDIMNAVIRRESIPLTAFRVREEIRWHPGSREVGGQRFYLDEEISARDLDSEWSARSIHTLGRLLEQAGHLVMECPAPAIGSSEAETCGTWFVAGRPINGIARLSAAAVPQLAFPGSERDPEHYIS